MSRLFGKLRKGLATETREAADPARLAGEVVRLYNGGQYRDAEAAARALVSLQRERLGERHADYATAQSNLGLLLWKLGDIQAAEPLLRQVLELRKDLLGESHPQYAASLSHLGELLQFRGDLDAAGPPLRLAVEVLERAVGPTHPDYATGLTSLALLHQRRGDLPTAERLLRHSLDVRRAALGEAHPQFATSLGNLGQVLQQRGDLDAAGPFFRQALRVRETTLGADHPEVGTSLSQLARLLNTQGRRAEAELLMARSVAIRRASLGESHPEVAADLNALAALRDALRPAPVPAPKPVPTPPPVAAPAAVKPVPVSTPVPAASVAEGPPSDTRTLLERVRKATESFNRVGTWMADESVRMRTLGQPADVRLPAELAACERAFRAVRDAVAGRYAADAPGLGLANPGIDARTGLPSLMKLLQDLSHAEEAKVRFEALRTQALARVDAARSVRHRDPAGAGLLQAFSADVDSLQAIITGAQVARGLGAEVQRVLDGSHPVALLLRLADHNAAIADEEWADLYRTVARAYGGPLAAAAARKRLTFQTPPDPGPARRPDPAHEPMPLPSSAAGGPAQTPASRPPVDLTSFTATAVAPATAPSIFPAAPSRPSRLVPAPPPPASSQDLTDEALGDIDLTKSRMIRFAPRARTALDADPAYTSGGSSTE